MAMASTAPTRGEQQTAKALSIKLDGKIHPAGAFAFFLLLVAGAAFAIFSIASDLRTYGGGEPVAIGAFLLLGLALLIALGFEFVNGFHDTANAVATVIYTKSLPPLFAVVWSGFFNFLGVAISSGTVAYAIVTMLPVELILQTGSAGGYAMIFSLLIAAVVWNLGTWWFGLPNSSSHALIGSILGVGLANQLLHGRSGASGVDWGQALKVLEALAFSPVCGFVLAAGLLLVFKLCVRSKKLYEPADPSKAPPLWIRSLLILTCTGVSFAHGGNDGQKGMGIIMLILIGVAPTAYALNRTMPDNKTGTFVQASAQVSQAFAAKSQGQARLAPADASKVVDGALTTDDLDKPAVYSALSVLASDIGDRVKSAGAVSKVPAVQTKNVRNEMYMTAQAITVLDKKKVAFPKDQAGALKTYKGLLNDGTRFIPYWVKITVALALGLGTMIGWKRIVVTVGEKIGKQHLSYGQGASAEIVAAITIGGAEFLGLPVSTTHILSSGVAGTMVANGSGLQWSTVRNIALAWVLTLPCAITIAGLLYAALSSVLG
ncbi:MAG: inorganic phosphate transporter, partial [Caulobacteraceae bacterium]